MEVLEVKNWKESTRNRKEWNKLVEKAKTHAGL
jgi:flagellar biosynthesis chaperone FliJ